MPFTVAAAAEPASVVSVPAVKFSKRTRVPVVPMNSRRLAASSASPPPPAMLAAVPAPSVSTQGETGEPTSVRVASVFVLMARTRQPICSLR